MVVEEIVKKIAMMKTLMEIFYLAITESDLTYNKPNTSYKSSSQENGR